MADVYKMRSRYVLITFLGTGRGHGRKANESKEGTFVSYSNAVTTFAPHPFPGSKMGIIKNKDNQTSSESIFKKERNTKLLRPVCHTLVLLEVVWRR